MAMCNECKKYPLEMREINEVELTKTGTDGILCDDCFKNFYKSLGRVV